MAEEIMAIVDKGVWGVRHSATSPLLGASKLSNSTGHGYWIHISPGIIMQSVSFMAFMSLIGAGDSWIDYFQIAKANEIFIHIVFTYHNMLMGMNFKNESGFKRGYSFER